MSKGLLISFDGLDSSGKATQVRRLASRLREAGKIVHVFDTPDYSTPSGQELKLRLQGKLGDWHNTSWQEKLGYFATNRVEHKQEVLDALQRGEIVIYDRYVPSSYTFMFVEARHDDQGVTREEVRAAVDQREYGENGMPHEDISLFLNVPPRVASELLEGRKMSRQDDDEYTDHIHVQEMLYTEYVQMCNEDPQRFTRIECVHGENLLSIEEVEELIWQALQERFSLVDLRNRG